MSAGQAAPPATTTEIPIPTGATAVNYQDYFAGQTKAGYQINSSPTSYIVYDKATGLPVKRVSNQAIEQGRFEGTIVLNENGSISFSTSKPDYLSSGEIKYTTVEGGQVRFKIQEKQVNEIYIDVNAPDTVLAPGTVKDSSNKIISGVVQILALGLELSVTNGTPSKSSGGQQGAEELTKKIRKTFLFGNGFENEKRLENTHDPLLLSYVNDLESEGIISSLKEIIVDLYEMIHL